MRLLCLSGFSDLIKDENRTELSCVNFKWKRIRFFSEFESGNCSSLQHSEELYDQRECQCAKTHLSSYGIALHFQIAFSDSLKWTYKKQSKYIRCKEMNGDAHHIAIIVKKLFKSVKWKIFLCIFSSFPFTFTWHSRQFSFLSFLFLKCVRSLLISYSLCRIIIMKIFTHVQSLKIHLDNISVRPSFFHTIFHIFWKVQRSQSMKLWVDSRLI